ncbi:Protein CBG16178 [Caenorhabditis briggsae]|uniref:Protein CBG16178 n=1 Tax=Caenorhabditis briggsae TaxID=6238 RepID=A8XNY3_CAEBR|nr:Protein CBG16178 [Caenorhabditis briggsae]CAP34223.1 Protein CBG16178 [Caenorhabditis briggsae]
MRRSSAQLSTARHKTHSPPRRITRSRSRTPWSRIRTSDSQRSDQRGSSTRDNRRSEQSQSARQSRPTTRSTYNSQTQRSMTNIRRSRSRNVRFASPPRQGRIDTGTSRIQFTSNRNRRSQSASRPLSQPRGNTLDLSNRYKQSSRWLALACLHTAYIVDRDTDFEYPDFDTSGYTPKVLATIKELTKPVKVWNVNTMTIPRKTLMPLHENYRGLDHKIDQMVIPDLDPNGKEQALCADPTPTIPNFTGELFLDIQTTSAKSIIEKAHKRINGINTVYDVLDISSRKYLISGDDDSVLKRELEFFADHNSKQAEDTREKAPKKGYLPVRIYKMSENEEEPFDNLQKVVKTSSILIIEDLCDVIGLKRKAFTLRELLKAMPEYKVNVSRQIPEPPEVNMLTVYDKKLEEKSQGWRANAIQHDVSLESFVDYYETSTALSIRALQNVKACPDNAESIIDTLQKELKNASLPLPRKYHIHPDATVIAFGTNIDINPENKYHKLKRQLQNVEKLPKFLRPTKDGDLMDHVPEILAGINTLQVYAKVPGVKTYPHIENGSLESVNVNLGPGNSVWYSVPLEYSAKLQELASEKMSSREKEEFFKQGYWPNEEECISRGIPIQKFIQRPFDTVYVGVGTYHWVVATGFTIQIAWNVASKCFRQLAMVAITHDHYLANKYTSLIPIEPMIWNMVRNKTDIDDKLKRLVKGMLCRSLANCKFEIDYVEKHNIRKVPIQKTHGFAPIERCHKCDVIVFNLLPTDTRPNVYCFQCLKPNNIDVVYQRYSIKKLSDFYDSVHLY